eukprot:1157649-Pelagomonas_calceolata.AAC.6
MQSTSTGSNVTPPTAATTTATTTTATITTQIHNPTATRRSALHELSTAQPRPSQPELQYTAPYCHCTALPSHNTGTAHCPADILELV